MVTTEYARTMARYNRWMNERLYAFCADMPDAERKRDAGAFFKSIHGTLNHLLVGDSVWMGRFQGPVFVPSSLAQELHSDFGELRRAREAMDQRILDWVANLTDAMLASELQYTSIVNPQPRRMPMGLAVAHFFNHQTHHRGQVHCMLTQCAVKPGATDLPFQRVV